MIRGRGLVPALFFALAGCSGTYQVVHMPQYEADLYPLTQTKSGVTIAVDDIRTGQRAERYFGADLLKEGVIPVNVIVSNFGKTRVIVKPSDILLYRGKEIVDPLPIEWVSDSAKRQHWFLRTKTEEEVDKYLENSTFKERILFPSESYRGVIFFSVPQPKTLADRWFKTFSVWSEGAPRLRVGLTNLDTGDRMLFGPFPVTLPER